MLVRMWSMRNHTLLVGEIWYNCFGKRSDNFFVKLNIYLPMTWQFYSKVFTQEKLKLPFKKRLKQKDYEHFSIYNGQKL